MPYTIATTWVCSNCGETKTVPQKEPTYEHGYTSSGVKWTLAHPPGWYEHMCKDCYSACESARLEGEKIGRQLQTEALERRAGKRD